MLKKIEKDLNKILMLKKCWKNVLSNLFKKLNINKEGHKKLESDQEQGQTNAMLGFAPGARDQKRRLN